MACLCRRCGLVRRRRCGLGMRLTTRSTEGDHVGAYVEGEVRPGGVMDGWMDTHTRTQQRTSPATALLLPTVLPLPLPSRRVGAVRVVAAAAALIPTALLILLILIGPKDGPACTRPWWVVSLLLLLLPLSIPSPLLLVPFTRLREAHTHTRINSP